MNKQPTVSACQASLRPGYWDMRTRTLADQLTAAIKLAYEKKGWNAALDGGQGPWSLGPETNDWYAEAEMFIEGVAGLTQSGYNDQISALVPLIDSMIDSIVAHQQENGYYNRGNPAPNQIFSHRTHHELIAAGKLIAAGVAHYQATGSQKLIDCAIKLADFIEKCFCTEGTAAFCTDPNVGIEQPLLALYRVTCDDRYRRLTRFFVEKRGNNLKDKPEFDWASPLFDQTHLPGLEQKEAAGYAVGALRLYSAIAQLAAIEGNDALTAQAKALFENIETQHMYITGAVGSTGRCFTVPYDLPHYFPYCELEAAAKFLDFSWDMTLLEADGRYGDAWERTLYNVFLASISLDGSSFFSANPLAVDPALIDRQIFCATPGGLHALERWGTDAINDRRMFYACRVLAQLGSRLYSIRGRTLYVHQFMASEGDLGDLGRITVETDYPLSGAIHFGLNGLHADTLALRIPSWCASFTVTAKGASLPCRMEKGYVYIQLPQDEITLQLDISPFPVEADPRIRETAGFAALQRGPMVYCLEEIDNGKHLRDITLDPFHPIKEVSGDLIPFPVLETRGFRREASRYPGLYRFYTEDKSPCTLRFIPYFAHANRGVNEMMIWIKT